MDYSSPASLVALSVIFVILTTALIVLRIISRQAQKVLLGPDDFLMIVAYVLTVVMCIVTVEAVADGLWGVALPMWDPSVDVSDENVMMTTKFSDDQSKSGHYDFANTVIFTLQLLFSKLSILFFLRRIFVVARRGFMHWATLVMIGFTAVWGIVLFFQGLLECPHDLSINYTGPLRAMLRQCQPMGIGMILHGIDPLIDVIIMLLPVRAIWQLHISLPKKLAVAGVFSIGLLSVAASFVRLGSNIQTATGAGDPDLNYNVSLGQSEFWQLFEAGFAVMAACLPSIQYLFRERVARAKNTLGQYYNSSSSGFRKASSATSSTSSVVSQDREKGMGGYTSNV